MNNFKFKIIFLSLLLVIGYWLLIIPEANASGDVLPYPSYMPGHKLYRLRQVWEKFQEYWSFGNLAQFKYHLKMANKYLVEAKTLFEYEQYLLAERALEKSNFHWQQIDASQKKEIFQAAASKHQAVLNKLRQELPEEILWQPEKQAAEELKIHQLLDQAKNIREKI